jgi:hypothetical protein
MAKRIRSTRLVRELDESPDVSYLKQDHCEGGTYYGMTSAERLAAFERGEWEMVGVFAEAEIEVGGVLQMIRTGGLWGIESDSSDEYMIETAEAEWDELAATLAELGFSAEDIQAARPYSSVPVF